MDTYKIILDDSESKYDEAMDYGKKMGWNVCWLPKSAAHTRHDMYIVFDNAFKLPVKYRLPVLDRALIWTRNARKESA